MSVRPAPAATNRGPERPSRGHMGPGNHGLTGSPANPGPERPSRGHMGPGNQGVTA
jgi:hypothetical protein